MFWLFFYLIPFSLFFPIYAEDLRRAGFFIEAAGLYWKAEEEGLGYAVESHVADNLASASIKNPDFDWDFGFKFGLGYRVAHDLWETELLFTSLQTHTDTKKIGGEEKIFFPVWTTPASMTNPFADTVIMHWRLHLGLLDALLYRTFQATAHLKLIPQVAVRTAWIRQKFNLHYLGGSFAPNDNRLLRMKNKYWGIGPKVGLTGEWTWGKGWSLYGAGGASLLFGQFYLHQDEDVLETKQKLLGIHHLFHSSAPILEETLGIRWKRIFSGSLNRLSLDLAWNQLLFFSQNQLLRFLDADARGLFAANQGDLSISGVQFDMRFDF